MKKLLLLCTAAGLIFASCIQSPGLAQETLPLRDNWALQSSARVAETGEVMSISAFHPNDWYPISVPTTVLAALVKNGVHPDPYYGDNLKYIPGYRADRWLVMSAGSPFRVPWWYRTTFRLPSTYRGRNLVLHFDGINYQANMWLNGRKIADADHVIGMFRRFEFDITQHVRFGEDNALAVETIAPGQGPDISYRTKQIEATTGWDDHNPYPPDMNMGIWQDVYVTATGPLRMRNPYASSKLDLPGLRTAHVTVSVEVTNVSDKRVNGHISGVIGGTTFSQNVSIAGDETKLVEFSPDRFRQLDIHNPRVWWPNQIGRQELYDLKLRATVSGEVSDTARVRFGIREATTYLNQEGWRTYVINGRKVLIRGAAWMTSDMLLRLTHKRYAALIGYARAANFNMLRSEGFSIRETDDFYNLCDEYGIMVTQQIFGRSIPDEGLALDCVKDMILRIRNHPCLVHFLGHDETFPTPTLDLAYRELIARYAPDRTYQPNSGAFEVKDRFETGGTRSGTRELWTYANPAHYYTHKESGAWGFAQSGGIGGVIAPIESMRSMMPREMLWPPWADIWSFHTVLQGGHYFDAMLAAMKARYGEPTGIEDFSIKGQLMNYESARAMYEAYARNKYSATGITAWRFDAAWPASPTWQYVDWYLVAGGAFYGSKKACEPVHVQYSYDDNSIWVANGFYKPFTNLKVTAKVYNLDMTPKCLRTATVDVGPDGKTKAFTIEWPSGLSKTYFLSLNLTDSRGKGISDNFYWLSTVPDIPGTQGYTENREFYIHPKSIADFTDLAKLPRVALDVESQWRVAPDGIGRQARVTLRNPSKSLAFFIHVAVTKGEGGLEVAPTFWDDNCFSLLPGEKKETTATFAMEDLGGATPVVKVEGWNVAGQAAQLNVGQPVLANHH
jgi:exo-1,4-beta-D-glucosaminidase